VGKKAKAHVYITLPVLAAMGIKDKIWGPKMEKSIFKDADVFEEEHQLFTKIKEREAEEDKILGLIKSFDDLNKSFRLFIQGTNGVGKTRLTTHICEEFREFWREKGKNIRYAYINCGDTKSEMQTLICIQHQATKYKTGKAPRYVLDNIAEYMSDGMHLLIVLDEIDKIKKTKYSDVSELIRSLVNLSVSGKPGKTSIIAISNNATFPETLDNKARQFLTENVLQLKPYNANQLEKILIDRVERGLEKGAISKDLVSLAASYAAKTNGQARYAINLIYNAALLTHKKKLSKITKEIIEEARQDTEIRIIENYIRGMVEHQVITLYAITQLLISGSRHDRSDSLPKDMLFSGEIYEAYEKICKSVLGQNPRSDRWFGEYLIDMELGGILKLSISGAGMRGNTTLVRLNTDVEKTRVICESMLGLSKVK
jgi:archaeal cell division control protein 6